MALLGAKLAVFLDEARTYEEDVSDANVSTFGFRTEIDTLEGCAGLQLGKADAVGCVGVIGLVMALSIVIVVQKDSTTGNPVNCPVVDAAAVVWSVTYKVGTCGLRGSCQSWGVKLQCTGHTPL